VSNLMEKYMGGSNCGSLCFPIRGRVERSETWM